MDETEHQPDLAFQGHDLSGKLADEDVPALSLRLSQVFESFSASRIGGRVVVEPRLRPELVAPGERTALDFDEPEQEGVEVVGYVGVELRRVDLTAPLNCGSS